MNSYLLSAVLLAAGLLLIVVVLYWGSKKKFNQRDLKFYRDQWLKIRAYEDGKHAVLDADKLLSHALKKRGFQGSVGDQLKRAGKLFSNLDAVWSAHKLRNRIAHELDMRLNPGDGQHALHSFEKALKDLGAL